MVSLIPSSNCGRRRRRTCSSEPVAVSKTQSGSQTRGEAIALAERYVALEQAGARAQAQLEKEIAAAKASHALTMEAIEPQLQDAFAGLRAWWAANSAELTKGKRRSIELGPVTLGERTGMPKLKLPKGMKAGGAIAWLHAMRYKCGLIGGLVRIKEELDKPHQLLRRLSAWSAPSRPWAAMAGSASRASWG